MTDDPDEAFGLMHIGGGTPELGFVRISELESLTGYQGKGVYHDPMFKYAAPRDILEYANDARILKQIVLQFDETIDVDDFYS